MKVYDLGLNIQNDAYLNLDNTFVYRKSVSFGGKVSEFHAESHWVSGDVPLGFA